MTFLTIEDYSFSLQSVLDYSKGILDSLSMKGDFVWDYQFHEYSHSVTLYYDDDPIVSAEYYLDLSRRLEISEAEAERVELMLIKNLFHIVSFQGVYTILSAKLATGQMTIYRTLESTEKAKYFGMN